MDREAVLSEIRKRDLPADKIRFVEYEIHLHPGTCDVLQVFFRERIDEDSQAREKYAFEFVETADDDSVIEAIKELEETYNSGEGRMKVDEGAYLPRVE